MHKNVQVFIDHDNDWLIQFLTPCEHLTRGSRCAIYARRPKLCRDYPPDDTPCEYEVDEPVYQKLFRTPAEFERYLERKGVDWGYKKLPD
jgi:Fe-S-cluster containining protein